MLMRSWIVDSTLHQSNVLLRVILHLVKTNILCWGLANLADNVIESPLDKLVKAQHSMDLASFDVRLVKELLMDHLTFQSAHCAHWSKTISTRDSNHNLTEAIGLLF